MHCKSNLVLIGMPGSGKSTIGVLLAKYLSKSFVDTDILIQQAHKRCLQDILDKQGYLMLRKYEEEIIVSLQLENTIIATGGSAVYSSSGMDCLRKSSMIVYLKTSFETLSKRITNYDRRGIANPSTQNFQDIFTERTLLYTQYAELTIDTDGLNHEEVVQGLLRMF